MTRGSYILILFVLLFALVELGNYTVSQPIETVREGAWLFIGCATLLVGIVRCFFGIGDPEVR